MPCTLYIKFDASGGPCSSRSNSGILFGSPITTGGRLATSAGGDSWKENL
jgi:hypothetical protein